MHSAVLSLLCPQKGGDKLGYEAEALAIYDTMRYVKPAVGTVCVGSAYGEAALLLAAGEKVPGSQCVCTESEDCVELPLPPVASRALLCLEHHQGLLAGRLLSAKSCTDVAVFDCRASARRYLALPS